MPLEAINDLKLRFELLGAGVVWIDDAQLFPLKFSEDERLERHFAQRPGNPYRRRRAA